MSSTITTINNNNIVIDYCFNINDFLQFYVRVWKMQPNSPEDSSSNFFSKHQISHNVTFERSVTN